MFSKCLLFFMSGAYFQVHCRLDFIMEANTMNPEASLYCLQYRLVKILADKRVDDKSCDWQEKG